MKQCHQCGEPWEDAKAQPGVKDICEKCSAYLHCCLNCKYFDPKMSKQCYIPETQLVSDKESCNFCGEFEFADAAGQSEKSRGQESARNRLDALFGDSGDDASADEQLDGFRNL